MTIPVDIRNALGLREGDRVEFVLEDRKVLLVPKGSFIDRTAGIVPWTGKPLTAEELREAAEDAIVEDVEQRSR